MTEETGNNVQQSANRMGLKCRWWILLEEGRTVYEGHRIVEVDIGKTWLRNAYGHKIDRFERDVLC